MDIITGKFKIVFEAWLLDNGYTPKYFEVLKENEKGALLKQFIKTINLPGIDIQDSIGIYNEYYDNINNF